MNERIIRRYLLNTDGNTTEIYLPIGAKWLYAGCLAGVHTLLYIWTLQDESAEQPLGGKLITEKRTFLAVKTNEQICLGEGVDVVHLGSANVREMEYHVFEIIKTG